MIKGNFIKGLRTVLPVVLFIVIVGWITGTLFYWIECIELLFPDGLLTAIGLPEVVIKLITLFLICVVIWIIGMIANQPYMSKKFKSWLNPIIYRVPILSHLSKISNQMTITLKDSDFFKEAVLVETIPEGYEIGFITNKAPEAFCRAVNKKLVAVAVPFYPYTSARVLFVNQKKLEPTGMTVKEALTCFSTLAIADMSEEMENQSVEVQENVVKESHSVSEWDFFIFKVFWMGCFFCL